MLATPWPGPPTKALSRHSAPSSRTSFAPARRTSGTASRRSRTSGPDSISKSLHPRAREANELRVGRDRAASASRQRLYARRDGAEDRAILSQPVGGGAFETNHIAVAIVDEDGDVAG